MKKRLLSSLHVPSWRRIIAQNLQSMKVLFLLSLFATVPATHATVGVIGAEDPLQIHVDDSSLHSQVLYTGLSGQVYPSYVIPGAFGTFLLSEGTLYGSIPPAGFTIGTVTNYTPVNQTITGNGTVLAPYKLTTIVDVGTTGIQLEQINEYVSGNEYYAVTIILTNSSTSDIDATLYRAMDCYLAGSDLGYTMLLDSTMGSVACTQNLNNDPPALIEALTPLTAADNYMADWYSNVWTVIGTHEPLPNTIQATNPYDTLSDSTFDNGQAISWNITIPAGGTVVRSHLTNFSPTGNVIEDADGDGISDEDDNCPKAVNPDQLDDDNNGIGNVCETDVVVDDSGDNDGDTINNSVDNCTIIYNPDQADSDNDSVGDACDAFPLNNTESVDTDNDGIGNNADTDDDNDTIIDENDNCSIIENTNQIDTDGDGIGDACDTSTDRVIDTDNDGIADNVDNCSNRYNPGQVDADGDNVGDTCDAFPLNNTESLDTDNDGIGNNADLDDDNDGIADTNDAFPVDASETIDTDNDGVGDNNDNCPSIANAPNMNIHGQFCGGIAGISCPSSYTCIDDPSDDCDPQNGGADCGGICNGQEDTNGDGVGDACETNIVDTDNDSVADSVDNCPNVANADQIDMDNDGIGDACDSMTDSDGDGVIDSSDNCPATFNIDQADSNANNIGDACDVKESLFPVYHFWSEVNGVRFSTIGKTERDYIIATYPTKNWKYIGVKYYAFKADSAPEGTSPVYRFWSNTNRAHFFTINEAEKDMIIANYPEEKWKYGGVAWYAYKAGDAPEGTIPIYRFYSALNKVHLFTSSESEKDYIIATYPEENWKYSGIAWYAYK